jgi:ElaB/YqjD/DUF883 family membrane-anchored ribosome-binding protein
MTDDTNTPSQMVDGAKQAGRDAAQAMDGFASEAQAKSASTVQSLRPSVDEAKAAGREALNAAKGLAGDAWERAQGYAKNAGGVAGEKLDNFKAKASEFQGTAARRISDEPIKAVAIGAAAGALIAALFMRGGRGTRRY